MPKTKNVERQFVGPTEFAAQVGVDRNTVLRWLKTIDGKPPILKGTMMGSRWLIPTSEVDRLLTEADQNVGGAAG